MFWLKKVLSQLVMPIPMIVFLLLFAILFWRYRRLARPILLVAVALLVTLSSNLSHHILVLPLESQYAVNRAPMTNGCLVMVLGSGHDDSINGSATQQLSAVALARLTEGIKQLKLGQDCKLVLSGWSGGLSQRSHADTMTAAAIELGVSQRQIITLPLAKDTIEEAQYMKWEVGDSPFRLVTSATHMPRAMHIFRHAGLYPQASPTDFIGRLDYWWRLDAQNLAASQRAIHEYIGLIWLWITQD